MLATQTIDEFILQGGFENLPKDVVDTLKKAISHKDIPTLKKIKKRKLKYISRTKAQEIYLKYHDEISLYIETSYLTDDDLDKILEHIFQVDLTEKRFRIKRDNR